MFGNYIFVFIAALYGTAIGSFLNVLIDRLPLGKNIISDRSKCDFCHKTLQWYELIPLISFFIQGGKCRKCHKTLSFQYPLLEIITGLLFAILTYHLLFNWVLLLGALIVASALLVIFVIDVKHYIIPDSMIIVGFIGSVIIALQTPETMIIRLLSGIGSLLALYSIWFFTKGKGMGFGDVKFAFLMGFLLGFPGSVVGLYAAFLTGAVVGLILMLGKFKTLKSRVPFGPFLIIGCVLAVLYTEQIVTYFF
jgi:prepilin signal peptidase PulO-like enzyme (type II secretory pathway)